MKASAGTIVSIEMQAVATPAPGVTLQELITKLEASGHQILEIYEDSVLIAKVEEKIDGSEDTQPRAKQNSGHGEPDQWLQRQSIRQDYGS